MKNLKSFALLAFFLLPLSAYAQSKPGTKAQEGDKVWLIINYVKNESKQPFEQFMDDVFFKVLTKSQAPKRAEQNQKTRWLTPDKQNEDGTWTYVFIMDPVVANADYDIEKLFQEQYSAEKSAELMRQYESYIARSDFHAIIQSKH